jgi:adenylate kinase family enzyme
VPVARPSVLQLLIGGTLLGVRRIAVVGSGGAGKSTCARRFGALTGIPVIHLDCYFWKPGWAETPAEQWRALQADLGAGDSWIMDGNYGGTFDVRFARADTVVVLAMPRWLCLTRAMWRTFRRSRSGRSSVSSTRSRPDPKDLNAVRQLQVAI